MKGITYIRTLGLAVLALAAFSVVGVSTASAKRPTWWLCEKAGPGSVYNSADCKEATGGEWEEKELAEGVKLTFTSTSGIGILYSFNLTASKWEAQIECLKDKDTGEIETSLINGEKVGLNHKVLVTFEECTYLPNKNCLLNGAAADKGTITTLALDSMLAYKPGTKEVVDVLLPEVGNDFATIKIEPSGTCIINGTVVVKESIIGGVEPQNAFTLSGDLVFAVNASPNFSQALTKYVAVEGGTETTAELGCEVFGVTDKCSEQTTDLIQLISGLAFKAKP